MAGSCFARRRTTSSPCRLRALLLQAPSPRQPARSCCFPRCGGFVTVPRPSVSPWSLGNGLLGRKQAPPESVVMAVYTEVSDDELETFLAEYDIGDADSFKGV